MLTQVELQRKREHKATLHGRRSPKLQSRSSYYEDKFQVTPLPQMSEPVKKPVGKAVGFFCRIFTRRKI
jgi:molybdopterin-biosynthesis enzyme MoeA-like protein